MRKIEVLFLNILGIFVITKELFLIIKNKTIKTRG